MSKRRSKVEENEIAVEILKVQAQALQQYAEDFEFGYIDATELRKRLNQQARALLEVTAILEVDDSGTATHSDTHPDKGDKNRAA